jgi:hypothetical protein
MEMDLGSTIIGVVIIIICALPFIMINRSRKKREKQFLQSLSKIAAYNNCKIDQHEIFGYFSIGIDETKKNVFFSRQTKDKMEEQSIDLNEIQNCKVINTSRTFKNNNGNQRVIDKLELSFIPTAKNTSEITLEFFNADESLQYSGELQSIEKWSELINSQLKTKK